MANANHADNLDESISWVAEVIERTELGSLSNVWTSAGQTAEYIALSVSSVSDSDGAIGLRTQSACSYRIDLPLPIHVAPLKFRHATNIQVLSSLH